MEKSATLNLRINPALKRDAEAVLSKLGIPMSTAVDMFLNQVVLTGGIPFSIALPKEEESGEADVDALAAMDDKNKTGFAALEERVRKYWTKRSRDFGKVRKNELENDMGKRWLEEITAMLPKDKNLRILDVGTGTGFFAMLLTKEGYQVEGVDLTPAMIEEARDLAEKSGLSITFKEMDAQKLAYEDESFDVVLSRNLTWTLPDPKKAYGEWYRVLKKGGLLLNFDANYAANVRSHSEENAKVAPDSPYGHIGMTKALQQENDEITLAFDIGSVRPSWDEAVLDEIGFSEVWSDAMVGKRILGEMDLTHAPLFGVFARK